MEGNRRWWILGGGLVAMAVILLVGISLVQQAQQAMPTPTPGPTQKPEPIKITCLGGQIFLAKSKEYLLEKYNIEVEYISVGSFEMAGYENLDQIDCIWPGSASAYEEFVFKKPELLKGRKHETVFRTYEVLFTRRDLHLGELLKAGIVYKRNGVYFTDLCSLATAMDEGKSWKDLGADIPGLVNVGYSAPERSSGGLQHLFLMGGCFVPGGESGDRVLRAEDLGSINDPKSTISKILNNWEMQPLQDTSSPDWFNSYTVKSSTYVMAASSESLYLGWYNNLPAERRDKDGSLIVGIYPEWSIATDHVLAGLNEKGDMLVEIFRTDSYLQQLGWEAYGMRTAVGGIGAKPGDTKVDWILADPQAVGEPKKDVFDAIKAALAGK